MDGKTKTVIGALSIVAVGIGLVVASVPLYRLVCRVTGYNGTPRVNASAPSPDEASAQTMVVRFDTNVMPDMPWQFRPETVSMKVHLGEPTMALFRAVNLSDQVLVGTATFNVTPDKAASYFNKIQCFCFTQQRLGPHETAELPVTFYVDPKITSDPDTDDVQTITLSYTFFKSKDQDAAPATAAVLPSPGGRS